MVKLIVHRANVEVNRDRLAKTIDFSPWNGHFRHAYGMAKSGGTAAAAAVETLLDRAWEAGISAFDTAPA